MNTSILEQELAPLEAQIEQARQRLNTLRGQLSEVEAELDTFSADRERFDALRDVCDALDKLGKMKAGELFWEEILEAGDPAGRLEKVRARITGFEGEISGIVEKQQSLNGQINRCLDELEILEDEVREAYDRDERRQEEFVVEREISSIPYRAPVMPWARDPESDRFFRRTVLLSLCFCLVISAFIPLIEVPLPDRLVAAPEIPKRLVQMVKKELPKPAPIPRSEPVLESKSKSEPKPEQVPEETNQAKAEPKARTERPEPNEPPKETRPVEEPTKMAAGGGGAAPEKVASVAAGGGGASAARYRAERVGVLKFKNAFKDLMNEVPVARLGTEAPLGNDSTRAIGKAVAQRSLVAIQAEGGSSGGIGGAGVSRNIGNSNATRLSSRNGFGAGSGFGSGSGFGTGSGDGSGSGEGFAKVESSIANLEELSRPTSEGLAAGRTDEEIQIVFDRYKAVLYRIYNRELRKDPTLRGKMLMRISIEPDGAVTLCKVESTDLASPELVAMIVERIRRFNFGPKEGVQKMTILYPIDFLPAS